MIWLILWYLIGVYGGYLTWYSENSFKKYLHNKYKVRPKPYDCPTIVNCILILLGGLLGVALLIVGLCVSLSNSGIMGTESWWDKPICKSKDSNND